MFDAVPNAQGLVKSIQAAGETAVTESGEKLAEEWLTGAAGREGSVGSPSITDVNFFGNRIGCSGALAGRRGGEKWRRKR